MGKGQKIAVGIVLGVPLVCCLGGVLTGRNALASASSTLEADLSALKSRGFPTEPKDLRRKIPLSESENAAPLYIQATQTLKNGSPESQLMKEVMKGYGTKATDTDRKAAAEALPRLAKLVALAERAADLPHCDFHRDWSKGFALEFPEFSPLKDLSRLLSYKAERQSEQGDWRGALRSITRAQRTAQHAKGEGVLIGNLVYISGETTAHASLRRIAEKHGRNKEFLAAARETVADFGPLPSMREAMGAELVASRVGIRHLNSLEDISRMTGGEASGRSSLDKMPIGILRSAFEARLLHEFVQLERELPKDPEDWEQSRKAMGNLETRVDADETPLGIMNRILLPIGKTAAEAAGKLQTERRLTETSLRLLQARLKGKLPSSLPADPKVSGDPFGTGPLQYEPKGNGFTLYSFGPNRQDDEGKIRSGSSENYDIVVKFR